MNPPKDPGSRRYKYVTQLLTRTEAALLKKQTIQALQQQIDALESEVQEIRDTLEEVAVSPLATERTVQVTLYPGDDGYEEASPIFSLEQYQGDFEWKTT